MKVLLLGSNGQLGGDLAASFHENDVVGLTHADIEVTDQAQIASAIETYDPDLVINTAAYHKMEEVEKNPEKAFAVNAIAPWYCAQECKKYDKTLVWISTDYVFGGDPARAVPYQEDDLPAPVNIYGVSKLAGEKMIQYTWAKHYIVRTSGLYGVRGSSGKGGNFVETMLRLDREGKDIKVVDDQRLTPTFTEDLAKAIKALVTQGLPYGLYHITSEGDCSWYEFAQKIFELCSRSPSLKPIDTAESGTSVRRPAYSVLSKSRLAAAGLPPMRAWEDALKEYLVKRGHIQEP